MHKSILRAAKIGRILDLKQPISKDCPRLLHYAPSYLRRLRPYQSTLQPSRLCPKRSASFIPAAKLLYRENPLSMTLATISLLCSMGLMTYTTYYYKTYIIDAFAPFPEPVAKPLRRALFYTNMSLSPKSALKYYRKAIEAADECGLDPFSDEVLGIKIQVAAMLAKANAMNGAIHTLELVRTNCLQWLDTRASEFNDGRSSPNGPASNEIVDASVSSHSDTAKMNDFIAERQSDLARRRNVVLKTAVAISVRLAEYYTDEYIRDSDAAEERLVWAVTTALKEKRRRDVEGIKEDEGPWLNDEEMGASLESLAEQYSSKRQSYLATPLYLQALTLCPPQSCHSVTLMSNLASSLALQAPRQSTPPSPSPSAISTLDSANQWAKKALELAQSITPPDRTDECDAGCAVATINLGDIAMMADKEDDAQRFWEEGMALSKAIGLKDGVSRAQEGLRSLEKRRAKRRMIVMEKSVNNR